ncbi:MAG TPA: pilin [Candidatus Saccharimonadales bacterium]|nr:pilin [Candidatus Saccharimonadales bacterium]
MKKNFIAYHLILFVFSALLILLVSHFTSVSFAYAAAVEGTPCTDQVACQDNPQLYCNTDAQTCAAKGVVDAACRQSLSGTDCQSNLGCIDNKCVTRAAAGADCDPDNNSQDCQQDNFCNPDENKCKPKGNIGAKCDTSLNNEDCEDNLVCSQGKCASLKAPLPPCGVPNQIPCPSFDTGFGKLSTNVNEFMRVVFGILLSFSGGIALLLMIRAGYKIMTSEGKPEAVKEGRDQMIAAIVGIIFLIFAFVFLELIGVSILRIPLLNP